MADYVTTFTVTDSNLTGLNSIMFNPADGVNQPSLQNSPFTYDYTSLDNFYPTFEVPGYVGDVASVTITETGQSVNIVLQKALVARDLISMWDELLIDHNADGTFGSKCQREIPSENIADYQTNLTPITSLMALDATVSKAVDLATLQSDVTALSGFVALDATVAKAADLATLQDVVDLLTLKVALESTLDEVSAVVALDATVSKASALSALQSSVDELAENVALDSTVAKESTLNTLASVVAQESTLNNVSIAMAKDSTVAKEANLDAMAGTVAQQITLSGVKQRTDQLTFSGVDVQARIDNVGILTDSAIAIAVWDEQTNLHTTTGTFGESVNNIEFLGIDSNRNIDQCVYTNGVLTSCRVRVYSNPNDAHNGTSNNIINTFNVVATQTNGQMTSFVEYQQ